MRNVDIRVCRKMMVQRQQFVSSSSRVLLKGIQRALKITQSYTIATKLVHLIIVTNIEA